MSAQLLLPCTYTILASHCYCAQGNASVVSLTKVRLKRSFNDSNKADQLICVCREVTRLHCGCPADCVSPELTVLTEAIPRQGTHTTSKSQHFHHLTYHLTDLNSEVCSLFV